MPSPDKTNPTEKREGDIMAVDIVILPSEPITNLAIALSERICESSPIVLRSDDYRPHISVAMGYIQDIATTQQAMTDALETFGPITIKIGGITWSSAKFNGYQFYHLGIQPDNKLTALNELLVDRIPTVEMIHPSAGLFVQEGNPDIVPDVFSYIANFANKHSGPNYWPHITLGAGPEGMLSDSDIPNDIQREFTIDKLSIFQLGNYCTCRRLLAET